MYNNQSGIKFLKKCVNCIKHGHVGLFCYRMHLDHHWCSYGYRMCTMAMVVSLFKRTVPSLSRANVATVMTVPENSAHRMLSSGSCRRSWCRSSVTCNMGDSGFPHMCDSHGAGVSEPEVTVNHTSDNASLRAGQSVQRAVVRNVITAWSPLYPTTFNYAILLWGF